MTKKFPPYGKQLMQLRKQGQIPRKIIQVVFDWKIARAYPRIIIQQEIKPADIEFCYLAGLAVQVVFKQKDAVRVNGLVEEILKVEPLYLFTFALDLLDVGATTILKAPLSPEAYDV
jgi:hypothetical protein